MTLPLFLSRAFILKWATSIGKNIGRRILRELLKRLRKIGLKGKS